MFLSPTVYYPIAYVYGLFVVADPCKILIFLVVKGNSAQWVTIPTMVSRSWLHLFWLFWRAHMYIVELMYQSSVYKMWLIVTDNDQSPEDLNIFNMFKSSSYPWDSSGSLWSNLPRLNCAKASLRMPMGICRGLSPAEPVPICIGWCIGFFLIKDQDI